MEDSETGNPEKVTTRAGWKPRKKNYEGRPEAGKDFLIEDGRLKIEDYKIIKKEMKMTVSELREFFILA